MEVKSVEKPKETSEKTPIKDTPKVVETPIKEQPIKEIKCSLICGEVNYII